MQHIQGATNCFKSSTLLAVYFLNRLDDISSTNLNYRAAALDIPNYVKQIRSLILSPPPLQINSVMSKLELLSAIARVGNSGSPNEMICKTSNQKAFEMFFRDNDIIGKLSEPIQSSGVADLMMIITDYEQYTAQALEDISLIESKPFPRHLDIELSDENAKSRSRHDLAKQVNSSTQTTVLQHYVSYISLGEQFPNSPKIGFNNREGSDSEEDDDLPSNLHFVSSVSSTMLPYFETKKIRSSLGILSETINTAPTSSFYTHTREMEHTTDALTSTREISLDPPAIDSNSLIKRLSLDIASLELELENVTKERDALMEEAKPDLHVDHSSEQQNSLQMQLDSCVLENTTLRRQIESLSLNANRSDAHLFAHQERSIIEQFEKRLLSEQADCLARLDRERKVLAEQHKTALQHEVANLTSQFQIEKAEQQAIISELKLHIEDLERKDIIDYEPNGQLQKSVEERPIADSQNVQHFTSITKQTVTVDDLNISNSLPIINMEDIRRNGELESLQNALIKSKDSQYVLEQNYRKSLSDFSLLNERLRTSVSMEAKHKGELMGLKASILEKDSVIENLREKLAATSASSNVKKKNYLPIVNEPPSPTQQHELQMIEQLESKLDSSNLLVKKLDDEIKLLKANTRENASMIKSQQAALAAESTKSHDLAIELEANTVKLESANQANIQKDASIALLSGSQTSTSEKISLLETELVKYKADYQEGIHQISDEYRSQLALMQSELEKKGRMINSCNAEIANMTKQHQQSLSKISEEYEMQLLLTSSEMQKGRIDARNTEYELTEKISAMRAEIEKKTSFIAILEEKAGGFKSIIATLTGELGHVPKISSSKLHISTYCQQSRTENCAVTSTGTQLESGTDLQTLTLANVGTNTSIAVRAIPGNTLDVSSQVSIIDPKPLELSFPKPDSLKKLRKNAGCQTIPTQKSKEIISSLTEIKKQVMHDVEYRSEISKLEDQLVQALAKVDELQLDSNVRLNTVRPADPDSQSVILKVNWDIQVSGLRQLQKGIQALKNQSTLSDLVDYLVSLNLSQTPNNLLPSLILKLSSQIRKLSRVKVEGPSIKPHADLRISQLEKQLQKSKLCIASLERDKATFSENSKLRYKQRPPYKSRSVACQGVDLDTSVSASASKKSSGCQTDNNGISVSEIGCQANLALPNRTTASQCMNLEINMTTANQEVYFNGVKTHWKDAGCQVNSYIPILKAWQKRVIKLKTELKASSKSSVGQVDVAVQASDMFGGEVAVKPQKGKVEVTPTNTEHNNNQYATAFKKILKELSSSRTTNAHLTNDLNSSRGTIANLQNECELGFKKYSKAKERIRWLEAMSMGQRPNFPLKSESCQTLPICIITQPKAKKIRYCQANEPKISVHSVSCQVDGFQLDAIAAVRSEGLIIETLPVFAPGVSSPYDAVPPSLGKLGLKIFENSGIVPKSLSSTNHDESTESLVPSKMLCKPFGIERNEPAVLAYTAYAPNVTETSNESAFDQLPLTDMELDAFVEQELAQMKQITSESVAAIIELTGGCTAPTTNNDFLDELCRMQRITAESVAACSEAMTSQ